MPKMPLRRTYLLRTLFFFIGKLQMFQNYRCKLKSLLHITPTSLITQLCCIPWYKGADNETCRVQILINFRPYLCLIYIQVHGKISTSNVPKLFYIFNFKP